MLLFALGGLAPAAAESTSLYPAFGGFALRVPDAPHAAMAAQIYSQTGPSPTWLVSQWNIAGPWLAPFSFSSNAEGEQIYTASAPAAAVRIAQSAVGTAVTLRQNSAVVPCRTAEGAPWESDLLLSSTTHALGVTPGRPSPYVLSELTAMHEIVTVAVMVTPAAAPKACKVTTGGAILAIVLEDFAATPHQTFFYQLHLNRFCGGRPGGVCNTAWDQPLYFSRRNPYGCDDALSRLGQALLQNGVPRRLDIDVLPGLLAALAGAPPGMDHDPADWSVSGGYIGQISIGAVDVTSQWSGYQLLLDRD